MKKSGGLLLFRHQNSQLQLFLIHPGGPFFKNKDAGAWSIPKGEFDEGEDPFEAAKRELKEETGFSVGGDFIELEPVKQKGGKVLFAWAVEADLDPEKIKSNEFEMEWPPKSGKMQSFPVEEAKEKINKAQIGLIEDLIVKLNR